MDSAEEGPVELRPSELDRYSPVRVSALLVLPESNARSFQIASALGTILDGDGTRNRLKSAKDATGVQITKKRRERIIDHLGISPRRWRQLVDDWERRQIAHRCSSGTVVLFTRSFLVECPSCHQPTEATKKPSTAPKPKGRPFGESGSITSAKAEASLPPSGVNASTQAAQTVPFLGTKQEHPTTGVAIRAEEKVGEVQPSELPLDVRSEVSSEGSKNRPNLDSKAWPVPEGGWKWAWNIDVDGKANR